mmetsp:Transcript_30471/g.62222  ORF Transcript_30471/g.62222 Transcript_30471/m.62222 type:complete len:236 (+) Transcript_30471:66-773(+)
MWQRCCSSTTSSTMRFRTYPVESCSALPLRALPSLTLTCTCSMRPHHSLTLSSGCALQMSSASWSRWARPTVPRRLKRSRQRSPSVTSLWWSTTWPSWTTCLTSCAASTGSQARTASSQSARRCATASTTTSPAISRRRTCGFVPTPSRSGSSRASTLRTLRPRRRCERTRPTKRLRSKAAAAVPAVAAAAAAVGRARKARARIKTGTRRRARVARVARVTRIRRPRWACGSTRR